MTAKTHEEKIEEIEELLLMIGADSKHANHYATEIVVNIDVWVREKFQAVHDERERLRTQPGLCEMTRISQEGGGYDGDSHNPLANDDPDTDSFD